MTRQAIRHTLAVMRFSFSGWGMMCEESILQAEIQGGN